MTEPFAVRADANVGGRIETLVDRLFLPTDDRDREAAIGYAINVYVQGYLLLGRSNILSPEWMPYWNGFLPSAGANPDAIYGFASIVDEGVYRISGRKGRATIAGIILGKNLLGVLEFQSFKDGTATGIIDLNALPSDDEPFVSFILSASRPANCAEHWVHLPPGTDHLVMRQIFSDWSEDKVANIAIERLDVGARTPPDTVQDLAERRERSFAYVERYIRAWKGYLDEVELNGFINSFELAPFQDSSGMVRQCYLRSILDLNPTDALLIEIDPPRSRYWGLHLTNRFFESEDAVRRHSSINSGSADIGNDGICRIIVSASDPGIANWLDSDAVNRGALIGRWIEAERVPSATVRRMPIADAVAVAIAAGAKLVTAEMRSNELRRRQRVAQWRHRW